MEIPSFRAAVADELAFSSCLVWNQEDLNLVLGLDSPERQTRGHKPTASANCGRTESKLTPSCQFQVDSKLEIDIDFALE
jgi:hypothetical protein